MMITTGFNKASDTSDTCDSRIILFEHFQIKVRMLNFITIF